MLHTYALALPSPNLLASSSTFSLNIMLQVLLARTIDLFARTPDPIFSNT